MLMHFATFVIPYALRPGINIVSKCRFFFIFKHSRASKRSWKFFHGVLESPGFFFVSKRVGTLVIGAIKQKKTQFASVSIKQQRLSFWTG